MNTTKWRELKSGVCNLPFSPPLVIKSVDEDEKPYHIFDKDVTCTGDWELYLENYLGGDIGAVPYYAVEWVKVRPRYVKSWSHRLIPDPCEIAEDATEQFEEILKNNNIPYEEEQGTFVIYGYK